jgi:nicotinamidase-related amidase
MVTKAMTTEQVPRFIGDWLDTLAPTTFADAVPDPSSAAIFSTDMTNGFLHFGTLASDRVGALAVPVASLFQRAWDHGIRQFILPHDTHSPDTPEFESWPPHCVAGTPEADTIPELLDLPFADSFTVIEKNSLNPAIGTGFDSWLEMNRNITTAIVVGNCTDLCVYQLAMHLRMRANSQNIQDYTVIVPTSAVDTFDIVATSESPPGSAHPGDFFHAVFLYHMAQNGIRIVTSIA